MAKAKKKSDSELSFADILQSKDNDMRESYFKSQSTNDLEKDPKFGSSTGSKFAANFGSSDGKERFQHLMNTIASSALFKTKRSVAIVSAVVTLLVTLSFSSLWAPNPMDTTTLAARISGGVALTEDQLREVVKEIDQKVYWAGPMRGAKYTINAQNFNSIYVRYLADGKGISDQTPKYRVIATYKEANAYNSTLSAGNQANGLSFTKPDGRVVYYNKQVPTNVYVAFKSEPDQIESFDPNAKTSLAIANSETDVQLIS